MNDRKKLQSDRGTPARQQTHRPPIQWPVKATHTPDNQQAAQLARHQLERTYLIEGEPNQKSSTEHPVVNHAELKGGHHNNAVAQPNQQPPATNGEPVDWQQYHTAWQQYYHQYFYRYYAGWWQQQKRHPSEPIAPANPVPDSPASVAYSAPEQPSEQQETTRELRQKVRNRVQEQAKRVKSSSHFKPLMAALTIGCTLLLLNYNQIIVGFVKQYISPGGVATTPVIVEPSTQAKVGPEPKIIIPRIGVEAPVVYDEPDVSEASYQKALERGVVRLGNTANPGTNGNVVIGGHSSNNIFNSGKYKYVFVNLKKLEPGDIFYLNYNSQRFTYKVTSKSIVSPQDTSVLTQTATPTVTLFTCDPPGTDINRLIIRADQIDPNPNTATTNTNQQTEVNQENPLPSVSQSLWDRLF